MQTTEIGSARMPRRRRREAGRLVPVKNASSARNARSKKIGSSRALQRALQRPLDKRFAIYKTFQAHVAGLEAHLGGEAALSTPQRALVEQAARQALLEACTFGELLAILQERKTISGTAALD